VSESVGGGAGLDDLAGERQSVHNRSAQSRVGECLCPRRRMARWRQWRWRQQIVYELASALVAERVVPLGLYRRAKELLGDAGIVDVTVLLGWFTAACMTLAAFDVPSNAVGLEQ